MGGYWINCCKCGTINRFRTDTCWLDSKRKIHDIKDWKCSKCGFVFFKGEIPVEMGGNFDGTEGQDRENYSDEQDRKNYTEEVKE